MIWAQTTANAPPAHSYGLGVDWVMLARFMNPLDWSAIVVLLLFLVALAMSDPAFEADEIAMRWAAAAVYVLLGVAAGCFVVMLRWMTQ